MKVLIVEDEKRLAEAIQQILAEQKYSADLAFDGVDGYQYAMEGVYDAVILDVMLPGMDGFTVVKELRDRLNCVPVLMLTAREELSDKVEGLDCGADDYMTKPFEPEELLARLRALTRRQRKVMTEELSYEDLKLNISARMLSAGEKSIHLGFKEYEVMYMLMRNTQGVTSKEQIIGRVWGRGSDAESNNVEAYISFLRKKLNYLNSRVTVGTVRKVGYRLEVKVHD